jgi:arabinose-5-phosphate isomerase
MISELSIKKEKEKAVNSFSSDQNVNQQLKNILTKEAQALTYLIDYFPDNAVQLAKKIYNVKGRVVFLGIGKSGLVARKLAATFSSLGIPSFFLHPTEALHGDAGMVRPDDFCLILSKSGTGKEFEDLILFLRSQENEIGLVCCRQGVLCSLVDLYTLLPFQREAGMLNLAPTSSSTVMMAFGDALAEVVSTLRNFKREDFARRHPAGSLGKTLLLKVSSFMHPFDQLPFVQVDTPFKDLVFIISSGKSGVGIVVNQSYSLLGIITDGDLRRACEQGAEVFDKTASDIMTVNPRVIEPQAHAYKALALMEDFAITSLVVTENGKVVGLVHIHDLVKAGIGR